MLCKGDPTPLVEGVLKPCGCGLLAKTCEHRALTCAGYRLVRYTDYDGWYVPAEFPAWFGWREWWVVVRKYYLALPFRKLRNLLRRMRPAGPER